MQPELRDLLDARGGLHHRGRVSYGGASRLLPAADVWFALTLARDDDVALVPALVQHDDVADPWDAVTRWAADLPGADVVARGCLLGLPIALLGELTAENREISRFSAVSSLRGVRVVDLSSLWAGPLCGALLAEAGADVTKVESVTRPDGARRGDPAFFERLNGMKRHVTMDIRSREFRSLVAGADVVIEASRPRALAQLGIAPGDQVWVSITGYGRSHDRVAFGDDAAVAGGLVAWDDDGPLFWGDAAADPLTGVTAAAATCDALANGTPALLDIAMASVAASYAACRG